VSEIARLTLVSHAMTDAMSAGRFPLDEPLNAHGLRQARQSAGVGPFDYAYCAPEVRTRRTAELLGLEAATERRLADLDCGRWRGRSLEAVESDELMGWLTDPDAAPHGGESVVGLLGRVREWLTAVAAEPARVVAVTHPAVMRSAVLVVLDAPAKSFWRIDIAPLSRCVMHHRGNAWTLRAHETIDQPGR